MLQVQLMPHRIPAQIYEFFHSLLESPLFHVQSDIILTPNPLPMSKPENGAKTNTCKATTATEANFPAPSDAKHYTV